MDSAGRRAGFGFGSFGESFLWGADGLVDSIYGPTGNANYTYTTGGLLATRSLTTPLGYAVRTTAITARDGLGQPLSTTNWLNNLTGVGETLAWTGDRHLSTHTIADTNFTDSRAYFYEAMSRRLAEERQNIDNSHRWTNLFTFDNAQPGGPGVLNKVAGSAGILPAWSGSIDPLARISIETNSTVRRLALGTEQRRGRRFRLR